MPEQSEQKHVADQKTHDLAMGRAERAQKPELGAPPDEVRLGRAENEKPAHKKADETQGREVETKSAQKIRRLLLALLGCEDESLVTETSLERGNHVAWVGVRENLDVDLMELSPRAEERLRLGDVHDGEPRARERRRFLKIGEGADDELRFARADADFEAMAQL